MRPCVEAARESERAARRATQLEDAAVEEERQRRRGESRAASAAARTAEADAARPTSSIVPRVSSCSTHHSNLLDPSFLELIVIL